MKKRSRLSLAVAAFVAVAVSFTLLGCGKNFYFAGRTLPPQRRYPASPGRRGQSRRQPAVYGCLLRHPPSLQQPQWAVLHWRLHRPESGDHPEPAGRAEWSGSYSSGDGSLASINYAQEKQSTTVVSGGTIATSLFGSHKQDYFIAADQNSHAMMVFDVALGSQLLMNVPNIYRVSMNPNASLVLGFVQNSNDVFSLFKLTSAQQTQYSSPAQWQGVFQDCERQTLPKYCVTKVADPNGEFDRPGKAIFSADGQSIYVLNCGQECGGTQAGIVTIPVSASVLNPNPAGPAGLNLQAGPVLHVPGGATNALQDATTLYVAGQQLQPDGLLAGNLSVVNLGSYTVTAQYAISDGTHNKMSFADDNTLWIGSHKVSDRRTLCQKQRWTNCTVRLADPVQPLDNAVTSPIATLATLPASPTSRVCRRFMWVRADRYRSPHPDFAELDNTNVTVTGTVSDVAYMDGSSDANNTTY